MRVGAIASGSPAVSEDPGEQVVAFGFDGAGDQEDEAEDDAGAETGDVDTVGNVALGLQDDVEDVETGVEEDDEDAGDGEGFDVGFEEPGESEPEDHVDVVTGEEDEVHATDAGDGAGGAEEGDGVGGV